AETKARVNEMEERAIAPVVARQQDRAADRAAELVLAIHRPGARNEAAGVQLVVAEVLEQRAVEFVRSRSRRVNFEPAAGASVLGAVVIADQLELTDRFHRRVSEQQAAA